MESNRSEHQEQTALIRWANVHSSRYPELRLLFAIPNAGNRNIAYARKMKAEGLKAGVPDLFLPTARGEYHGLFIEMKRARGTKKNGGKKKPAGQVSELQKAWILKLREENYCAIVCYGAVEAKEDILEYLEMERYLPTEEEP